MQDRNIYQQPLVGALTQCQTHNPGTGPAGNRTCDVSGSGCGTTPYPLSCTSQDPVGFLYILSVCI